MNHGSVIASLALLCASGAGAAAPSFSAEAALVSDYRFRGISRSDAGSAAQASATLGLGDFYVSGFASSLGGWGRFAGADAEIDISAGVRKPFGLGTLDVGMTVYGMAGARAAASVVEAQARLSGAIGPVRLTAGTAWAPPQAALASATSRNGSNLYLWGSVRGDIIGTPLSVDARIGQSRGRPGLGAAGALGSATRAWDWRLGADYAVGPFLLGAGVTGTDLGSDANAALLTPRGRRIAGTGLVLSVSAGF